MSKQHFIKFLLTGAGEKAFEAAARSLVRDTLHAALYYVGVPDGNFFEAKDFPENVVHAKKAYVTLNTIMGGDTSEMDRFKEGKKQTPGLLTPLGVKKMVDLYTVLFCTAISTYKPITFETVRACRQTEVSEGISFVGPLTSTTKLSVEEIMALGYGNKNGLAICRYRFHEGAIVFDMENFLEEYYPKPDEREVLLLMGNKLVAHCTGYDDRYLGKDGQPALMYDIDVYPPEFTITNTNQEELENIVYNPDSISEIQQFFTALNDFENGFPAVPECYPQWKTAFKDLVYIEICKLF